MYWTPEPRPASVCAVVLAATVTALHEFPRSELNATSNDVSFPDVSIQVSWMLVAVLAPARRCVGALGGVGAGVGLTLGVGVGAVVGDAVGDGEEVGAGVGAGDGDGNGMGDAVGLGEGDAEGDGVGEGELPPGKLIAPTW